MTREEEIEKAITEIREVREMTKHKETLAMSEEEINIKIAEFMGLDVKDVSNKNTVKPFYMVEKLNKYGGSTLCDIPEYTKDLNLVYEVEEKLREMKLHFDYLGILAQNLYADIDVTGSEYRFNLIHASPIDRLRAALLTIKGVV